MVIPIMEVQKHFLLHTNYSSNFCPLRCFVFFNLLSLLRTEIRVDWIRDSLSLLLKKPWYICFWSKVSFTTVLFLPTHKKISSCQLCLHFFSSSEICSLKNSLLLWRKLHCHFIWLVRGKNIITVEAADNYIISLQAMSNFCKVYTKQVVVNFLPFV